MSKAVYCATLGCDKNLVDSEALLGRFAGRGLRVVADPDQADIWVLNTCGFIEAARLDSEEALVGLLRDKGPRTLVVCGCWSQEHAEAIRRRYPQVDVVAGVGRFDEVVAACLDGGGAGAGPAEAGAAAGEFAHLGERPLLTPDHLAFVKIAEGCDFHCSFCRIPLIRGRQRSRAIAEVEAEVRALAERGVQEIQVVSQNTGDFGRDRGEDLHALVERLSRVDGLRRIRLFYLYPGVVAAQDLLRILDLPKVVPYLDVPVQHAAERLLRAMKRPGSGRAGAAFFARLRQARPELVLRSTAMLGFPGEEDEDVSELADFLAEVQFDHLGTYRYCPEAGTPAAAMPEQVPAEIALDREALIVQVQQGIALRRQASRLGRRFEVVVDSIVAPQDLQASGLAEVLADLRDGATAAGVPEDRLAGLLRRPGPVACCRSEHFAYDIDGSVLMPAGNLRPGRWVQAEFRAVTAYDVWALPAGEDIEKGRSA